MKLRPHAAEEEEPIGEGSPVESLPVRYSVLT